MNMTVEMKDEIHVGDAGHNPFDEDNREVHCVQKVLQKMPVDGIESFVEIHFQHASGRHVLPSVAPCYVLADENIVNDLSPLHKRTLALIDEIWKDRFKA